MSVNFLFDKIKPHQNEFISFWTLCMIMIYEWRLHNLMPILKCVYILPWSFVVFIILMDGEKCTLLWHRSVAIYHSFCVSVYFRWRAMDILIYYRIQHTGVTDKLRDRRDITREETGGDNKKMMMMMRMMNDSHTIL